MTLNMTLTFAGHIRHTPRIAMSWHWMSSGRHCCHWAYYGLFTVHPWGQGGVDIVINFLAFHPASHT